jgi:hypothetical protein
MAGRHGDHPSHNHGLGAWLPRQLFELAQRVTGRFDDGRRAICECIAKLASQGGHAKPPSQVTGAPTHLGSRI